jgi:hypothetical protein
MEVEYAMWVETNFDSLEAEFMSALSGVDQGKGVQVNDWEVFDPTENPNSEPEKTALLMERVKGLHLMEIKRMDGDRVKSTLKIRRTPQTEGELHHNADSLIKSIGKKIHKEFGDQDDTVINFFNQVNYKITFSSTSENINRVQTEYKQTSSDYIPKSAESPDMSSFGMVGPTDVELSNNFVIKVTKTTTPDPFIVKIMESIKGISELRYTKYYSLSGRKHSTVSIKRNPPTDGDLLKDNGSSKLKEVTTQIKEHLDAPSSRLKLLRSIDLIDNNGISVRVFRFGCKG